MYSVAALSSAALVGLVVAACIFFLIPFYLLWKELFMVAAPAVWQPIVISQVTVIMVMRGLVDKHFREPFVSTFLHPFGLLFLILAAFYATLRRVVGAHIHWKKRLYGGSSGVE
jgi:hypothetical protein